MMDLTQKEKRKTGERPVIQKLKNNEVCTYCGESNAIKKIEYQKAEEMLENAYVE